MNRNIAYIAISKTSVPSVPKENNPGKAKVRPYRYVIGWADLA